MYLYLHPVGCFADFAAVTIRAVLTAPLPAEAATWPSIRQDLGAEAGLTCGNVSGRLHQRYAQTGNFELLPSLYA